jgi:peptide/nickel transport system substrate-binding protein
MKKFIVSFIIFLLLISCSSFENGKEITQGLYFFPDGLDPAKNTEFFEYQIFSQIYEPLLTLDDDYKTLLPCLADSWSVSENILEYTFQLRPDVQFHDGSMLTADVVQHSFMRQIHLRSDYPLFSIIDTIRSTGPLTIQIKLRHPYFPFLYSLASPNGLLVISQQALDRYGNNIDKHPVGTGPFYLDKWQEKKYITLHAFSEYRKKSTIDKITFILPDSTSQSVLLFKSGEIDILYMVAAQWLDRLKWLGRIEYFVQKPLDTIYLGFNLDNNPVNKIAIRKAILMAIDIKKSVIITNRGNAIPAEGPLPPIFKGFNDLKQERYNPKSAEMLIKEAGYINGLSLNLYVFSPAYSRQMKTELIKSQLAKIGITLITKFFNEWKSFADALVDENCHLFLDGYGSELIGDPGNFLYALFHSKSPYNRVNYYNKKTDYLLEQAFQEADEQKRHQIYRSIVKIILEDTPAVYDSHIKSHFAYNSKKIKSLVVNPYDFIYFHRLETYE